jgi:hypothetical protein
MEDNAASPVSEKQCIQDVAEIHDATESHKSFEDEDVPTKIADPDANKKFMDAAHESTCQIDHGKALVTEYVSDFG